MWSAVVTLVVGVVAAAASANWFAGHAARQRHRMKSEAELWALLPEGDGKRMLRMYLDSAAMGYVLGQELNWFRKMRLRTYVVFVVMFVGGCVGLGSSVAQLVGVLPAGLGWAPWAGALLNVGGVLWLRLVAKPSSDVDLFSEEAGKVIARYTGGSADTAEGAAGGDARPVEDRE